VSAPLDAATARALRAALVGLDRRGFLRLAAGAAAAGVLPLGCGAGSAPPAGATLSVLSPRTYSVMDSVARRIVGPHGEALIAARSVDPALRVDAWLVGLGAVGASFEAALWTLELGVWPLLPKLRPFTALDPAAQDAVLADLQRSRLALKRRLFGALKTFACLGYYADPASHAGIGYPAAFGAGAVSIADAMI
jgi:hypothetical protein